MFSILATFLIIWLAYKTFGILLSLIMKTRFYLTKNCVFLAKEVSLRYNPYTVGLCTHELPCSV